MRIEVLLEASVEDAWRALTDRSRLGAWLGEVDGELRVGSVLRAQFRATGWEGTVTPVACEQARRLLLRTTSEGEPDCTIEVTLEAVAAQTLAVFEDRGLPLDQLAAYGAGDQVLVEHLAAHLSGRRPPEARERWQALHPDYQALAARSVPGAEDA